MAQEELLVVAQRRGVQIAADVGADLEDAVLEEAAAGGKERMERERSGSGSECAIVVYGEGKGMEVPGMSAGTLCVISSVSSREMSEEKLEVMSLR